MEKMKVIRDLKSGTLTIWFGDPSQEHVCEETGDSVVLIKNKSGTIIGFEYLNYSSESEVIDIETLVIKATA